MVAAAGAAPTQAGAIAALSDLGIADVAPALGMLERDMMRPSG